MRRHFALACICALLAAALGAISSAQAAPQLYPLGKPDTAPVGRTAKIYFRVADQPVVVPVVGPGQITGYVRAALSGDPPQRDAGTLDIAGVPGLPAELPFTFAPSRSSRWADDRPGVPSSGRKFNLEIPAGRHDLQLTGQTAAGADLWLILYYDGPAQPDLSGLLAPVAAAKPAGKSTKKKSPWSFRYEAGLDLIYNTNILTDSAEYENEFETGLYPEKFIHHSTDDLVTAPSFQIEARRNLVSLGQSRFRFKVKHWLYTHNPIKTNTDFDFYIRQYVGKWQSLELYLHAAPEQYIGQLTDRSPLDDPDSPIQYKEFRFQRNIWNLTWRQKINRSWSAKVLYERNYRYYNKPFMENDIEAWEVRFNTTWKINRTFTLNLDYSFEDAEGRGYDEVGETALTSDNSDGSYERDLYRIGLDIRAKSLKKYVDRIGVSFLFMDYYYTTTRTLVEDPYHVGRNDRYYKATFEVRRKLAKPIEIKLATRRTQRTVSSPWEGDITTDKDFTQWLYWVSLSYRF